MREAMAAASSAHADKEGDRDGGLMEAGISGESSRALWICGRTLQARAPQRAEAGRVPSAHVCLCFHASSHAYVRACMCNVYI